MQKIIDADGHHNKRFRNIVSRSSILAHITFHELIMKSCKEHLGNDFLITSPQLNVLHPGYNSYSFHVDYPYFKMNKWSCNDVALSRQFVWCVTDFNQNAITDNLQEQNPSDRKIKPECFIINAKRGSLIEFDPRVLHSSSPNSTNKSKISLLICAVRRGVDPMEVLW